MSFQTAIAQPEVGIRFYVKIQGIPHVFVDGPTPVGPDGSAWSAPTSGGYAYAIEEHTIADQVFEDIGPEISRSTSDVSPAAMTIRFQETPGGALLDLFARDKTSGNRANLEASFGYDDGSPPSTMTVDATAGWPSPAGYLYFGRETIRYGAKTSTTFGTLTRDLFSIGDCDAQHTRNEAAPSAAPRVVTDHPRVWRGRYLQLFAFVVDADGVAFDDAFDGDHSQEIWRGVISGQPTPANDWHTWEIRTDSIEAILSTDVGPRAETKGTLLRVAGGVDANAAGEVPWQTPEGGQPTFWLDDNTRYLHVRIVEDNAGTITELDLTGADAIDVDPTAPGAATALALTTTAEAAINATVVATFSDLSIRIWWSPEEQRFAYSWKNAHSSRVYETEIQWERQGSVGYLTGYRFYHQHQIQPGTETAAAHSNVELLAAYIHPTGQTIPFYFEDAQDLATPSPPEPGFAVIGDEIVSYESIDAAKYLDGMFELTGCKRGRMGTVATEHQVKLAEAGEEVEIRFGVGFESEGVALASKTTPGDAILQLAISTGAGHRGSYDTLPASIAVPLPPGHFDAAQWSEQFDKLPGLQRWIDFILHKPEQLSAIAAEWLQPFGLIPYAGIAADGGYKIRLTQILGYLEAGSSTRFDAGDLKMSDPARHMGGSDRLINEVHTTLWDVVRGEAGARRIGIVDEDSVDEHGERSRLEWTLRGYRFASLTDAEIRDAIATLVIGVFRRFSQPYDLFQVSVGRAGWFVTPGDSVLLTVPGVPTFTGERGLTDRPAVVLQTSKRFNGPDPGADLVCIVEPEVRQSSYVPSGLITGYSAGQPSITISASAYSPTSGPADATHFEVGDAIWVYKAKGDATRVEREIDAIAGNVITIDSALPWTPSAGAPITGADYDAVTASQRKHAHIADGSAPPVLSVSNTTAFKYAV